MEAAISGLPAVAVSLDLPELVEGALDYGPAAHWARVVTDNVIRNGLPPGVLLNVNVPYLPLERIPGAVVTRQGLRIYRDELVRRADPRGRPYYWIGGEAPTGQVEEGTDVGALHDGFVSITPIQLDLTAHTMLDQMRKWEWRG
jgi:5'-nucleotidase